MLILQQQQQQQQQQQKSEKLVPRQPLPNARAPPIPIPDKQVPRQPVGRKSALAPPPQRLVDNIVNEPPQPTSIRDIMVRKARDERSAELRARREKRRRDQLLTLPAGAMGLDGFVGGGNQPPTSGGTPTSVHFAEEANKDKNEANETPASENGRRTRLRSSSLGTVATEKPNASTDAPSAKTPNVKMTGAPTLLKSALKKSSQVANNTFALANAPPAVPQQQQAQNVHTPRVKIVDGQIVADQETLTVQASHENRITESEFTRTTGDRMMINSQTYGNRSKPTKWTKQETELFYKAMEQFGTDFTLIQRLFPSRTRRQVKAKYLKEQNSNDDRIESCMNNTARDNGTYQNLIDVLQSDTSNRVEVVAGKGIDMITPGANNIAAQVLNGDAPMQENVAATVPQGNTAAATPAGN